MRIWLTVRVVPLTLAAMALSTLAAALLPLFDKTVAAATRKLCPVTLAVAN